MAKAGISVSLKLLRGILNGFAIFLAIVGLIGLFYALAWAWLIAIAAVLVIAVDCVQWISDDCGYSDTPCAPFSTPTVHTPSIGCTVHRDGRDPLRRGPDAYPLTKRPTWDTDIFGAPE